MDDLSIRKERWIGKRVQRVEDPRFLTGAAKYVADLVVPRMLHAVFVRSPLPHARITSIDPSALPGLGKTVWVLTGEDLAEVPPLVDVVTLETLKKTPQPVIARGKVRFVGEAVAIVAATDRYAAEDAAEALGAAIEYEPLPPVPDVAAATAEGAAILFEEIGTNEVYRETETHGDVAGAFERAEHTFSTRFYHNRYGAAPMECRGVLANFDRADQQLTVWSSTQMPHFLRSVIARQLCPARAEGPRHRARGRRRLRTEDGHVTRGDRHPVRGRASSAAESSGSRIATSTSCRRRRPRRSSSTSRSPPPPTA